MSVHLLGVGSMGTLLAHKLVQAHPAINKNFTLLFRNIQSLDAFRHQDSKLVVNKRNNTTSFSTFHSDYQIPKNETLENLVVACKAHQTEGALRRYVPNITPETNIVLVQNGMGVADRLIEKYWPYKEQRPNIYQCISTHGAFKSSPFVCNHVGVGRLDIGRVPLVEYGEKLSLSNIDNDRAPPLPIIDLITSTKPLHASYLNYPDFLLKQIEKLVVNTCINPLTAIFDCLNGELLYTTTLPQLIKKIIREDIRVLKMEYPVLGEIPETESVLDEERLLNVVLDVCQLTAKNSSSMREDVRLLKPTEIYWLNGYITSLARKHNVYAPTNQFLESMVKEKLSIDRNIEKNQIDTVIRKFGENLK